MLCPSSRVLAEVRVQTHVGMYENQAPCKQHVTHLCFSKIIKKVNINPVSSRCAQGWTVKDPAVTANLTAQAWSSPESPSLTARPKTLQLTAWSKTSSKLAFPLDIAPHSGALRREFTVNFTTNLLWCYGLLAPRCRVQADGGAAVWRRTHSIYLAANFLSHAALERRLRLFPFRP